MRFPPIKRRYGPPLRPAITLGALLAVFAAAVARYWPEQDAVGKLPGDTAHVSVLRVVDGDTLLLTDHTRVRLLGVDSPEVLKPETPVEPWGPEASQFTRQFIAGKRLRLQFDRERADAYGRRLAYVWVADSQGRERMLNEELLRAGLARGLYHHPYSADMKRRFRAAEDEARRAKRGIWSGKTPDGRPMVWPFAEPLGGR